MIVFVPPGAAQSPAAGEDHPGKGEDVFMCSNHKHLITFTFFCSFRKPIHAFQSRVVISELEVDLVTPLVRTLGVTRRRSAKCAKVQTLCDPNRTFCELLSHPSEALLCPGSPAGDQTSHPGAFHQDHHHLPLRLHGGPLRHAEPARGRRGGGLPVPDPRRRLHLQLHHVSRKSSDSLTDFRVWITWWSGCHGDVKRDETPLEFHSCAADPR